MRLLAAPWLVSVVRPPLRRGCVAVAGGRVVWVGRLDASDRPAGPVEELGEGVLLPGLVNAHCHLELSALAGRIAGGRGFTAWVSDLVEARASLPPDLVDSAAAQAIATLERTGTIAVGDVSNALAHLGQLGASRLDAVVYFEQLGWDPAKAGAIALAADARLAALASGGLARNVELRLAAHAPHSVSAALFRQLLERGGPAALHLAESPDETRFLRDGDGAWGQFLRARVGEIPFSPPGVSPVAYVDGLGVLKPGLVAAHCIQVDAADRARLLRSGTAVVVCPRSNRSLGVGIPPVPELLADGVLVALGTDSLASAPSLELADDMVALSREFPALDPAVVVRIATEAGARALGRPQLGTIAPGMRAAFAFARANGPLQDPLHFLVSGAARFETVFA